MEEKRRCHPPSGDSFQRAPGRREHIPDREGDSRSSAVVGGHKSTCTVAYDSRPTLERSARTGTSKLYSRATAQSTILSNQLRQAQSAGAVRQGGVMGQPNQSGQGMAGNLLIRLGRTRSHICANVEDGLRLIAERVGIDRKFSGRCRTRKTEHLNSQFAVHCRWVAGLPIETAFGTLVSGACENAS